MSNVIEMKPKIQRLWDSAVAAHQKGLDAYIEFGNACAQLNDAGVTQQEIAQRFDMNTSAVNYAIKVGADSRIFCITKNQLPRSEFTLYLLTTLDDAGFAKLAKPNTTQQDVLTYKQTHDAAPKAKGKGRPRKGRFSWMRIAVEEGALAAGGGDRAECKSAVQRINADPDLLTPAREAELRTACRMVAAERAARGKAVPTPAPIIDRADLSITAQEKLDIAIRRYQRELDAKFAERERERERTWHDAVVAALSDHHKEEIARAKRMVADAEFRQSVWLNRARQCKEAVVLIMDNWRMLTMCLHPDRAPEDRREQFGKATDVLLRLKRSVEQIQYEKW